MRAFKATDENVESYFLRLFEWVQAGFLDSWSEEFCRSTTSVPNSSIPLSKVWGEISLIANHLVRTSSFEIRDSMLVRRLLSFVEDADFTFRLISRKEHFLFYSQMLALAEAMGMNVRDKQALVRKMLKQGAFVPEDIPAWEASELIFGRACLGEDVNFREAREAASTTVLSKLPKSICFFTELQAYRLTHVAFYYSGLGLPELYSGYVPAFADTRVRTSIDMLCARFFVQGQLDLALELILSQLLLGGQLNSLHAQCISVGVNCIDQLGYVPPYIFDRHQKPERSADAPDALSDFDSNYHATLVFLLLLSTLKSKNLSDELFQRIQDHQLNPNARIIEAIDGVNVLQMPEASPQVAIGSLLAAVDAHNLDKACYIFCQLDERGVIEWCTHSYLYTSIHNWLSLQINADGVIGFRSTAQHEQKECTIPNAERVIEEAFIRSGKTKDLA